MVSISRIAWVGLENHRDEIGFELPVCLIIRRQTGISLGNVAVFQQDHTASVLLCQIESYSPSKNSTPDDNDVCRFH